MWKPASLRAFAALAALSAGTPAAFARVHHSWTPVSIAKFGDWEAATHPEGGVTVCYAFVFAKKSDPVLAGRGRVVLSIAERPHERDAVAISLGYAVLPHAGAVVSAGGKHLHFYLEGRSAFATHGAEVIAALQAGREAAGRFPGPRGVTLTDNFSLNGFSAAYAAIEKACPATPAPRAGGVTTGDAIPAAPAPQFAARKPDGTGAPP